MAVVLVLSFHQLKVNINYILDQDLFSSQTKAFFDLGADTFIPTIIGGAVIGLAAADIPYFIYIIKSRMIYQIEYLTLHPYEA